MTEQDKYMNIWYGHIRAKIIVLSFNIELMITFLGTGGMNMVPNHNFQQYLSYIVAISFIYGVNRSTQRKPPTYRKSLTNFIT